NGWELENGHVDRCHRLCGHGAPATRPRAVGEARSRTRRGERARRRGPPRDAGPLCGRVRAPRPGRAVRDVRREPAGVRPPRWRGAGNRFGLRGNLPTYRRVSVGMATREQAPDESVSGQLSDDPATVIIRPRRTRFWRRPAVKWTRRAVLAALLVFLIVVGWSIGGALTAPGTDST